jgi:hypothetical protein
MPETIQGTVVATRRLPEDAVRLFGSVLGGTLTAITVRCEGAELPPSLAQQYDPGSLRAARLLRVLDCRVNGAPAWIVRCDGAEADVLTPAAGLKSGDAVTLSLDLAAQPRTLPVGGR